MLVAVLTWPLQADGGVRTARAKREALLHRIQQLMVERVKHGHD
jgi:hypothetical protein